MGLRVSRQLLKEGGADTWVSSFGSWEQERALSPVPSFHLLQAGNTLSHALA